MEIEESYYYSGGKKIPVFRLRTARVVRTGDRSVVSIPGWETLPLGTKGFQLLIRSDVLPERSIRTTPLHLPDLSKKILKTEAETEDQSVREEERSLAETDLSAIPALIGKNERLLMPTGEVIAQFPRDLNDDTQKTLSELGAKITKKVSSLPNTYVLEPAGGGDGIDLANTLVNRNLVVFAHPNFIEEMPWRSMPSNELFSKQWHLDNTGQNGACPGADVRALNAWKITRGSPNVIICILDSGIDSKHESFSMPNKLVPGFDFEDTDTMPDPTSSSHGTSCAGVSAASWEVGKVVGIAPDCRLMAIKRSGLSDHLKVAEAFLWAMDHGADIISCSFGYDGAWILPDVVRAAIDRCVGSGRNGKGCIVIWAAGNGNEPVSSDEWASNEKVIAVAASTDQDTRAYYSDFGPEIDVCAPTSGGNNGITTTAIGGYISNFGGTSSAAPLVAGIAGLLLSINPNLTYKEVYNIICQSADKIDTQNGRYDDTGHSDWYGYGRVNAFKALDSISVLEEAARGSSLVESRMDDIRFFANGYLLTRPAGKQIVDFLVQNKFSILQLLNDPSHPEFRKNVVIILNAVADISKALQSGKEIVIPDETWDAIRNIVQLLLKRPIEVEPINK